MDLRPQLLSAFPLQDPRNPKSHRVGHRCPCWTLGRPLGHVSPRSEGRDRKVPGGEPPGGRQTPQWPRRRRRPKEGGGAGGEGPAWTRGELRPEAPRSRRCTATPATGSVHVVSGRGLRSSRPRLAVPGKDAACRRCASTGVSPKSVSVKREKELKTLGTVDPDLFSSSWALLGKDSDLRVVGA